MTEFLPADVLAEWSSRAVTRTGDAVWVRPLRPDDRVREIAFINSLSEQTRFLRVMAPLRFLPAHLLDQLMDVDYDQRMAFVASVYNDGVEEFIGIARYGPTDEPGVAEFGVTVTDCWQRRGVAHLLLERLLSYARWRGFKRVCGYVLPENQAMLALARSHGLKCRLTDRLILIERDLSPEPAVAGG